MGDYMLDRALCEVCSVIITWADKFHEYLYYFVNTLAVRSVYSSDII